MLRFIASPAVGPFAAAKGNGAGCLGALLVVLSAVGLSLAARAEAAFPGQNGPVVFASIRDGDFEIYKAEPGLALPTRLTNHPGGDQYPAFSPDGARIAFQSYNRPGAGWARAAGRAQPLDGVPPSPPPRPAFHEQWQVQGAAIYVMNLDGSDQIPLTDRRTGSGSGHPAFSPDGRKIAFTSNRDGNNEIYVMNADGSAQTRLTSDPAADQFPAFSPDGRKVAFMSTRAGDSFDTEIYIMNADGSGVTRLTANSSFDNEPAFSPDGMKIAFQSGRDRNHEIYLMNVDGTGQTNLTNNPVSDWSPALSPDGTMIAFERRRDFSYGEIYVMNLDGTGQGSLTNAGAGLQPDWGPPAPPLRPPLLPPPPPAQYPLPERTPRAAAGACANNKRGTNLSDTIDGTAFGDRILGLGGRDILKGGAGKDCLLGGEGNDRIGGGADNDALSGGAGKDRLAGGAGKDRLTGGEAKNTYSAGPGNDTVKAANGRSERVSCGSGRDKVRADSTDRLHSCERKRLMPTRRRL